MFHHLIIFNKSIKQMRKLLTLLTLFLTLVYGQVLAQDRVVAGKVTSKDDGTPLPGVTVLVKGTTKGTQTDVEGAYKLTLSAEDKILVFSFIGMKSQEQEIGNRTTIDVALASGDAVLDEVVVTAIGIERQRRELTYATQNVSGSQLSQKSEPNILNALQGKVAGVEIIAGSGMAGSRSQIFMRGLGSATGNNQPLFVIDGVPIDNSSPSTSGTLVGGAQYSNRALDLDPNDIESMSVLKGASAASLYGARAANGAIMITTKKGKGVNKKLEVTVTSSFNVNEVNMRSLPKYQNSFGQGDNGVFNRASLNSWGPRFGTPGFPTFVPDLTVDSTRYQAYPDNISPIFNSGTMMENGVSLAGGLDKTRYFASINATNQSGIVPNSGLQRYSFRIGGSTQLSNSIGIDASIVHVQTSQTGGQQGNTGASPWFVGAFIPRSYDLANIPYVDAVGMQRPGLFATGANRDNPLWATRNNTYSSELSRTIVSATINYKPTFIKGLTAAYRLGLDQYVDKRLEVIGSSSRPSNSNWATTNSGANYFDNYYQRNYNHDLFVTYNKDITKDIGLRVLAGAQVVDNQTLNDGAIANQMNVPGWNNLGNFTSANIQAFNNVFSRRRQIGVYGNATLSYKNWLSIDVSARNDWFSTLPAESNSVLYPSISGSWIFTDALKMESNILSYGKLRGSWAQAGNDINPFLSSTIYTSNAGTQMFGNNVAGVNFPFQGTIPGYTLSNRLGGGDTGAGLRTELSNAYEFGGELGFFKGRLSLDVTYYYRSTTQQLFANLPQTASSGFTSRTTNAGEITNKGLEMMLDARILDLSNGFKWNVNVNFARNISKVESLAPGVNQIVLSGFATFGAGVVPGQPFGVFIGSDVIRDAQNRVIVNPGTGLPYVSTADKPLGDPNPTSLTGFTNTFSFKGFTASVVLQYQDGGAFISRQTQIARFRGVTQETADRERPFLFEGVLGTGAFDDKGLPISSGNPNNVQVSAFDYYTAGIQNVTRFAVFDATSIRLREVSITYELPKKWLEKTPFGAASIGFSGRNLWFNAPNNPHADPENNQQGGNSRGFEFNSPPSARTYGANLRFTF
jgi:TonB-linked SusC/RagA family outer membrane protein